MAFDKNAGKKGATLNALATWLDQTNYLDKKALIKAVSSHKHAENLIKAIQISI